MIIMLKFCLLLVYLVNSCCCVLFCWVIRLLYVVFVKFDMVFCLLGEVISIVYCVKIVFDKCYFDFSKLKV